jgi:cytochrome c2
MQRLLALVSMLVCLALAPAGAFAQPAEGRRALQRYGCASCHQVPGVRASRASNCVGCHQEIIARPPSGLGRAPHVEHYLHAPDLRMIARRLRDEYLLSFVRDPHDVRPRLEETMPRLPVTEEDARLIVQFLRQSAGDVTIPSSPAPARSNVTRGREVFANSGCPTCHEIGNLDFGIRLPPEALMGLGRPAYEAPNLRFARERLTPDIALQWILNPRLIDPETQMPHPELSRTDAIAVRDFIFLTDVGNAVPAPRAPAANELRMVSRRVRFPEVRRIFQRSCIHCHAHANGTGTSTAFGFEQSSLDLSTVEGTRAGSELPDGTHRSVIAPDESGVPPLVSRLLRRHAEAARDLTTVRADPLFPITRERPSERVGMPLGLPPVSIDDISVIATWIQQGAAE